MTYLLMTGFAASAALIEWDREKGLKSLFVKFADEFMSSVQMMIVLQVVCMII